jgi:hypothetical protein
VSDSKSNIEKLYEAGLIIREPLPEAYERVLGDLSDDEISTLISVYGRLKDAEVEVLSGIGAPLIECFVPL